MQHVFAHGKHLLHVALCATATCSRLPEVDLKPGNSLSDLLGSMVDELCSSVAVVPGTAI